MPQLSPQIVKSEESPAYKSATPAAREAAGGSASATTPAVCSRTGGEWQVNGSQLGDVALSLNPVAIGTILLSGQPPPQVEAKRVRSLGLDHPRSARRAPPWRGPRGADHRADLDLASPA